MHVEAYVKNLEHHAWEVSLVECSMGSNSFRIYNPKTKSDRDSRNVMFIETPLVMPEPDVVGGFNEGEFTYDDYDYMSQDVRNHTLNQDLSSPSPDLVIGDPSLRQLLEHIRETIDRDLGISPANSIPPDDSPSDASPRGESPAPPAKSWFAWGS